MTLDDWRWAAGEFNRIGEKVKAAGMTFGYHNHTPEFRSENGVVFYDELLRLTDPKLMVFEMDCGWVVAAGRDPVEYLIKTPERFPLLHVKDMVEGRERRVSLDGDGPGRGGLRGRFCGRLPGSSTTSSSRKSSTWTLWRRCGWMRSTCAS